MDTVLSLFLYLECFNRTHRNMSTVKVENIEYFYDKRGRGKRLDKPRPSWTRRQKPSRWALLQLGRHEAKTLGGYADDTRRDKRSKA